MQLENEDKVMASPIGALDRSQMTASNFQNPPDATSSSQKVMCISELPPELVEHVILDFNGKELANVALVCQLWEGLADRLFEFPLPPWLTDRSHVWKQIDCKMYGLDCTRIPRINRYALIK